MHAKMEFFERTPIGRILNRFSSDVSALDVTIPDIVYHLVRQFLAVSGAVIVVCLTTPYSVIVWSVMAIIFIIVQVNTYS